MPRTETFDLEAERDRIDARLDDLADEVAELEAGNPAREQKATEGQQLEREYVGVLWALNPEDEEDRDPWHEVTVSELTTGEYIRASERANSDAERSDVDAGRDTQRLYRVAAAVEDAPFVPEDAGFDETFLAVANLKPQFFFWLEQRVDELTTPEIAGNGFAERVAARTSENEPASPTPE